MIRTDQEKYAKVIVSMSVDFLQGKIDWEHYKNTVQAALDKIKKKEHRRGPKIICICGSTRFADLHAIKCWEFERGGENICLMINYLPQDYAEKEFGKSGDHLGEVAGLSDILDELHFRKIDISDMVYVINKDGYIGKSTKKEIEYAMSLDIPVTYMEEIK